MQAPNVSLRDAEEFGHILRGEGLATSDRWLFSVDHARTVMQGGECRLRAQQRHTLLRMVGQS